MKFKYCDNMDNHICFNGKGIFYCTTGNNTKQNTNLVILDKFNGEGFDVYKFLDDSEKLRNDCKNGNMPTICEGCHYIEDKEWDESSFNRKIKYILISNYRQCNSRCIYCISRIDYTSEKKDDVLKDTYNIIPVIKDMIDKKVVDADTQIDFAGGECTLYPYFEELLTLLIDSGIKNILIHSNAIKFSKAIENGIKKGVVRICVSIDAGSKRVHEKVKGVKTYNKVWDNVKKYRKAASKDFERNVSVKYIVVKGVNDTEKEIKTWIKKADSVGISTIRFNADNDIFINYQLNGCTNHPYLAKLIVLTTYALDLADEYDMEFLIDYNINAAYNMLNIPIPDC